VKKIEKPLCKLKKDQLAAVLPLLAAEVAQSRFICRRCARVATSKKWLCKPEPIEKMARNYQAVDTVDTEEA
jgi:hypothetical protein